MLILLLVETVETPNDGGGGDSGGESQQVNGENLDKCMVQDSEMEEGNLHSTWKKCSEPLTVLSDNS